MNHFLLFALAAGAVCYYMFATGAGAGAGGTSTLSANAANAAYIDQFVNDTRLLEAIKNIAANTDQHPFDFNEILKETIDFVNIYAECLRNPDKFADLVRLRKSILNRIQNVDLELDATDMATATWKYIDAIVKTHSLQYDYPVAHNDFFSAQDVY